MGREGLKVEQMGIEGRTLYSFLIFFFKSVPSISPPLLLRDLIINTKSILLNQSGARSEIKFVCKLRHTR